MYGAMIVDREELKVKWRQMVESDVAQIAEQFKRMYIDACLNVVSPGKRKRKASTKPQTAITRAYFSSSIRTPSRKSKAPQL